MSDLPLRAPSVRALGRGVLCPASSTSGRTPPRSASSSSPRASARTCAPPRSTCCTGDLTDEQHGRGQKVRSSTPWNAARRSLDEPETLAMRLRHPAPTWQTLDGFTALDDDGLAALLAGLRPCHGPGRHRLLPATISATRSRDPTITELRMIDTYWSDHCRHTTFLHRASTMSTFEDPCGQGRYERISRHTRASSTPGAGQSPLR